MAAYDPRTNNYASRHEVTILTGETDALAQCAVCCAINATHTLRLPHLPSYRECRVWLDEPTYALLLAAEYRAAQVAA